MRMGGVWGRGCVGRGFWDWAGSRRFLFLLTFLLVLCCCGLTGCGGRNREKIELSGFPSARDSENGDGQGKPVEIVIETVRASAGKAGEPSAEVKGQDGESRSALEVVEEDATSGEDGVTGEYEAAVPGEDGETGEHTVQSGEESRPDEQTKAAAHSSGTAAHPSPAELTAEYAPGQILSQEEVGDLGAGAFFYQQPISKALFNRMNGNSYKSGCPVAVEHLRYLRVLHYGYKGEIRVGELVCNQTISDDLLVIFRKLYDAKYPIEKMFLIDDYGGDDDRSSADNNTSCFNYRNVAGTDSLSRHALGIAIDINPVTNPYVVTDEEGNVTCAPANGSAYADRTQSFPHKIDEDDLCCRLFTEAGFTWGGSWPDEPDYMHFSRGSTPET